ncbi:hypothetical protein SprV_0501975500 [Sparganum proliferum]
MGGDRGLSVRGLCRQPDLPPHAKRLTFVMDLEIETIELLLQSKYDETENRLGHAQVLHLLKFCPRTYFMFDGTIYEQVMGTPMGSPISGFIAEAVLQRLEWLDFQHLVASASHSLSIRCWDARGLSLVPRVLQTNQRCPPFDWLAEEEATKGVHTRWVSAPRRRTQITTCPESALAATVHRASVYAVPNSTGCPTQTVFLTFDWESLSCRQHHFDNHRPKFWTQYVDDTFVVIERDQMLTFKERLNAVFPDIQFTMEEEENNQLTFMDVLVCRKDCGGLKTNVFRKSTTTMQVPNFNSNHSISHKRSCVRTLYRRVETYCSEPEDKIAELQYFRRVFRVNDYPRTFVNRCIRKRDERPNRTEIKFWRRLPHVKNVSDADRRLLAPLGFGVTHKPEAIIRCLVMKPKAPLSRLETSGVVYRVWCSCGQSSYVGGTGRLLRTRIVKHVAAVRINDANSQVAAHSTSPGHTFKFGEAESLARGDNGERREPLESWVIGRQSINKCNDLPLPY